MLFNKIRELTEGKKNIIWDWNGTLLDDVELCVNTVNTLLCEHDLPRINRQQYREIFDFPVRDYYLKLGFNYERESFESLCHRFVDQFMSRVFEQKLHQETLEAMSYFKQQNKKQALLSATDQQSLDLMFEHFKLENFLVGAYGIENKFAASKVARGFEMIHHARIHPQDSVLIGDTLHDLEVGKELGVEVILVSHGHQQRERLSVVHDKVI